MMDVLIAGAGISGLTAAIALRRHGHRVTLFEQSRLNTETGAAIFLPPNANGLLRRFGFNAEDYGANLCLGFQHYAPTGELTGKEAFAADQFSSPWHLIHRQELHAGLKALATDPNRAGPPAEIVTSSRVASVDADSATITLENGSSIQGHVVLGADGMRSKVRASVPPDGPHVEPASSGKSCFRFMIPRQKLLDSPVTKEIFEANNCLFDWFGADRRLVCYPCDDNTLMNFVALHPACESDASGKGWNSGGSKASLVSLYTGFGPQVREIVQLAEPESVRQYPLMDMQSLSAWTSGKVALLGDAAHPFLPHMGQGGAQAIEDAMSLGVFLTPDLSPDQVPSRLKLYEQARIGRAHRVQENTRIVGLDDFETRHPDFDVGAAWGYNLMHDELEHSQGILDQHLKQQLPK